MQKLNRRDTLLVGLTLFSMFFGAGNLIFPPFLGAQAGENAWVAMAGFALSAIGLPVLGVIAVSQAGGLRQLADRGGRAFGVVFTLLAYLSIGPGLAIPRTASTSFEMAVTPFAGTVSVWVRAGYSLAFFTAAVLVALRPEKLTDRLGRFTGPALLTLICVLTVGCIFNPPGGYGPAAGVYVDGALAQGFLDGYQTMDTIAALAFGIVIALNIQNRGVTDPAAQTRTTVRAGWVAGAVLLAVYSALLHIGAVAGAAWPGAADGTGVLTRLAGFLFGPFGNVLLGLVFVIACLNTCIGLLSSCGEFFYTLWPRLGLKGWVLLFAAVSFATSIAGLELILAVSVPVLGAIYPVAIVLILLGLAHRFTGKAPLCYPVAIGFTALVSVTHSLDTGLGLGLAFMDALPFYSMGLGWVLPAVLGAALGAALSALGLGKKAE